MIGVGRISGWSGSYDDEYAEFGQMTILCTPEELDKLIGFVAQKKRSIEVYLDKRGGPEWFGPECNMSGHYCFWDPDWREGLEGDSDLEIIAC